MSYQEMIFGACDSFLKLADDSEELKKKKFEELFERTKKQKLARQVIAENPHPYRIPMKTTGWWCLIHKSTKKPGWWQASYFREDDEPIGDNESSDFAALIETAHSMGMDWLGAVKVGRP